MSAPIERREVLFEFTVAGAFMKVAAIDATSGIEIVVLGPAQSARMDLKKLALAKLRRRLAQDGVL